MTRLGVGIVGCGRAAADIGRAVSALPTTFVAAVHDHVEENALRLSAQHGGAVHRTLDGLLLDPAVDIVYVAVTHDQLAPIAHRALSAGKHVLVEKPAGLDVHEVSLLKRDAANRGLRLGVVFVLRESAAVRKARHLIQNGALGPIRSIRIEAIIDKPQAYWHSGAPGQEYDSWRARQATAGGGVVLMNSIHQIDVVRHVTGLSFTHAMAATATFAAPVEVEDTAAAVLRLSNGALASLVACAHSPGAMNQERIEIDGALGRIDLPDPFGAQPLRLYLRDAWDGFPAGDWLDIEVAAVDSYLELTKTFAEAVLHGTAPSADADDAAAAVATVTAIYTSAGRGCGVEVPRPDTA